MKRTKQILALFFLSTMTLATNAQDNFRKPANDDDLRYWLKNMVWDHQYSYEEIATATGLKKTEILAAMKRFEITQENRPIPSKGLRVLPYPGGRHPRIGFLEGAIRPQRETKISIFTPWDLGSYAILDLPEAIWSNLGLTYLAHTHIDTVWTKQSIDLPKLEWNRQEKGVLTLKRELLNGIAYTARIELKTDHVKMELTLTNGTKNMLSDLRVQNCIMLKNAKGFNSLTNKNKLLETPFGAVESKEGDQWIIMAWEPCHRPWGNAKVPCIHSDPKFPDCKPGETVKVVGWLSFYEGNQIDTELERIRREWKKEKLGSAAK